LKTGSGKPDFLVTIKDSDISTQGDWYDTLSDAKIASLARGIEPFLHLERYTPDIKKLPILGAFSVHIRGN